MALIFDIETNGLLNTLDIIHSLVIYDTEKDCYYDCTDNDPNKLTIKEGLEILSGAPLIVGHNIIGFDLPAIQKLYPTFKVNDKIFDTLIAAKLIYPEIELIDYALYRKKVLPKELIGKYSLESFGYRLKELKGTYCKEENTWEKWKPEMQVYCKQDVKVTTKLYYKLLDANVKLDVLELEQKFAKIISRQEQRGVLFDKDRAVELVSELLEEQKKIYLKLQEVFKPKIIEETFIPKVNNSKKGYIKGTPFIKQIEVPFNPNSNQMVASRLIEKYNWKPLEFTETGLPKVSETILSELPYKEVPLLLQYIKIAKVIGYIAEGKNAWLKKVENDGAIRGKVDTLGTVTGRCSHYSPNLAQTPAVEKDGDNNILFGIDGGYGYECRALFKAREGFKLVGCDASGLELRDLAHYINSPSYTKEILSGDIHTKNQHLAGLSTRAKAKKFIYAFNYGAGDEKIGYMAGVSEKEALQYKIDKRREAVIKRIKKAGKVPTNELVNHILKGMDTKAKFFKGLPELANLMEKVKDKAKTRGYLYGIDKRKLKVREVYKSLNVLLQSAGATVMKKALIILYDECVQKGWINDSFYINPYDKVYFVLNIHDEFQAEVKPEIVEEYMIMAVKAIEKAGDYFSFKCPLTGEAKEGFNWAETH